VTCGEWRVAGESMRTRWQVVSCQSAVLSGRALTEARAARMEANEKCGVEL